MKNIKDILESWANWSVGRIGTEYKGMSYQQASDSDSRPSLDDVQGMVVDQAVGSLKRYDIDGYNIICLHYQHHISCRAIGRKMKKRPDYVTAYLGRAEAYIAGRIHDMLEAA